jgi:hypothetical protein
MNRLLRCGVAVALVALVVGVIANADAAPRAHSSASVLSLVKKYAKQYAKQYAKKGPRGPQGLRGPEGLRGPQGPSGVVAFTVAESPYEDLPPGGVTSDNFDANCPSGSRVVGTGFYSSVADVGFVKEYGSFAGGIMFNNTGITVHGVHIQAMCMQFASGTSGAQKVTASNGASKFRADRARALAR